VRGGRWRIGGAVFTLHPCSPAPERPERPPLLLACANTVELDDLLDEICSLDGVISSESLVHLATKIDRGQ